MEFKFCQNGSSIHADGMAPGTIGTESSIWVSSTHQFLLPQPPPPPLMTPIHHCLLTTIASSPPSHCHHHHHWPPPSTSVTHNHHNANDVAMPHHPVNDDQPQLHNGIQGATLLTAMWQMMNDDIVIIHHLYPK